VVLRPFVLHGIAEIIGQTENCRTGHRKTPRYFGCKFQYGTDLGIDPYSIGGQVFRELQSVKLGYDFALIVFNVGLVALEIYEIQTDASTDKKLVAIVARKSHGRLAPSTFRVDDLAPVKIFILIAVVIVFVQPVAFDVIYHAG